MELTDNEKKIVEAMNALKAISEGQLKTVDHIQRESKLPKGLVANTMMELVKKNVVKKVTREKAAGYYLPQV